MFKVYVCLKLKVKVITLDIPRLNATLCVSHGLQLTPSTSQ